MIFKFTPPQNRYDLTRIILGQASGDIVTLEQISSSTIIGSFPTWITKYDYPEASGEYYYAVKWEYSNGGYSDWSSPRMRGRTGQETNYIIVNSPTVSSIYIVTPVSGDSAALITTWMEYNKEYYITIDKTLYGDHNLPMETDYVLTFTSEYCPRFVTVNDIRYEVGDFINNLTDDTINRIIYKNSTYIVNKYYNLLGSLPAGYTCNGSLMNNAFKRYVLCKSSLDAITAIQLSTGNRTVKRLADVMFEYGGTNVKTDPINKKKDLKDCIDSAMNIIFTGQNFQIGVRGKYFVPIQHPMSDATYGRLSLPGKNYEYNMESKFDEVVLGDYVVGTGVA